MATARPVGSPRAEPDRLAMRAAAGLSDESAAMRMTIDSSY